MFNPNGVATSNIMFHQWGIWSYVGPICVALLGGVWWLVRESKGEIQAASLELQSKLAGVFQIAVIEEADKLLGLVESYLPFSLSQVDAHEPEPSAFDRLCQGLQRIDPDDPDRAVYADILQSALSGEISKEARRLLRGVAPLPDGQGVESGGDPGIRFGFEARTEHILSGIARETARCMRRERVCARGRLGALCFFCVAFSGGAFTAFVAPLFNARWAEILAYTGIAVLGGAAFVGLILGLIYILTKEQHIRAASRFRTPSDIEEFLLSEARW